MDKVDKFMESQVTPGQKGHYKYILDKFFAFKMLIRVIRKSSKEHQKHTEVCKFVTNLLNC